jgi:hypothetical protein
MAKKMAEETEREATTEKKVKKNFKNWTYDQFAGNVDFFTEGYTDGDTLKAEVEGVVTTVVINDNHGKYSKGSAFKGFPAVKVI